MKLKGLIPQDKVLHFIVGMAVAYIALLLLYFFEYLKPDIGLWAPKEQLSILAVTIIGAGKELKDLFGEGTPDLFDFVATVLGGLLMLFILTY